MKKKTGFLVLLCCVVFNLSAQFSDGNIFRFEVSFADNSNNTFFTNHPDIPKIRIKYNKDKAVALYIFKKTDPTLYKKVHLKFIIEESYDLKFPGDAYLLSGKYEDIRFPIVPEAIMNKIANSPKCEQEGSRRLAAIISKDSVIYEFQQQCRPGNGGIVFEPAGIGLPPKYAGSIDYLREKIEKYNDNTKQLTDVDSTLVFWGEINKTGDLGNLILVAGDKSFFSEFVKKQIEKPENKRAPADIGGAKMNSYIRIYIRLNSNGSIDVVPCRNLLIASGK